VLSLGFMPGEEDICIGGRVFLSLHKSGTKRRAVIVAPADVEIDRVPAMYPAQRRDGLNRGLLKPADVKGVGDG